MGFRYSVKVNDLPNGQANFYVFDRDAYCGAGRLVTDLGAFGTFDAALEMAESMEDTSGRPEREVRKVGCTDCQRTWTTGKPAPVCECGCEFVATIVEVQEVEESEYVGKGYPELRHTPATNVMYVACGLFRKLKDSVPPVP